MSISFRIRDKYFSAIFSGIFAVITASLLSGCVFGGSNDDLTQTSPQPPQQQAEQQTQGPVDRDDIAGGPTQVSSLEEAQDSGILPNFGEILPIPGMKKKDEIPGGVAPRMGINTYLWRSTLDTLSFMPLQSADPVGGVIITDWYSNPEAPSERFKVTVYILDQNLRADGLKVSVFKQQQKGSSWVDAAVDPATPGSLEDAILTRARQLRVAQY